MRSHVGETAPFVVCPTWIGHALSSCHWDYLASKSLGSHALASTLESFQLPVAAERVQGCASSKHSKGDAKVTDTLNSQVFYSHRMCFISGGSPLQVGHVLDKHGTFHIEHFISLYSMNELASSTCLVWGGFLLQIFIQVHTNSVKEIRKRVKGLAADETR